MPRPGKRSKQEPESTKVVSTLFKHVGIDEEDEFERMALFQYKKLSLMIEGKTSMEKMNCLVDMRVSGEHGEYQMGLLYGILAQPRDAVEYKVLLDTTVRDGYSQVMQKLKYLTHLKFEELQDQVIKQVLWLVSQWMESNVLGIDAVLISLMRNIRIGDRSPRNMDLVESVVSLLETYQEWILGNRMFIPYGIYLLVRLIHDHEEHQDLKIRETNQAIFLLENGLEECTSIGRDFVRVIQESQQPEIVEWWKTTATENPELVERILKTPTRRRFLISRLLPNMEIQLYFLMEQVRLGSQKRYQQWFCQMYLSEKEMELILPDLVRYICCVYHPSNAILCSDVVPRWAILGWIFNISKNKNILSQILQGLYYDWINCSEDDSIMNIEPGILLLTNSISKYPGLVGACLEYLKWAVEVDSKRLANVHKSMKRILEQGVIGSLEPLYRAESTILGLRDALDHLFGPFLVDIVDPVHRTIDMLKLNDTEIREEWIGLISKHLGENCENREFSERLFSKMLVETDCDEKVEKFCRELIGKTSCFSYRMLESVIRQNMFSKAWRLYSVLFGQEIFDRDLERYLDSVGPEELDAFYFRGYIGIRTHFKELVRGNPRFIRLMFRDMDHRQCNVLESRINTGTCLLSHDKLVDQIQDSLGWESFQQMFFWRILIHENVILGRRPGLWIVSILKIIDGQEDPESLSEALGGLVSLMMVGDPEDQLIEAMLEFSCGLIEEYVIRVLRYWSVLHRDRMAIHVTEKMNGNNANSTKMKRIRQLQISG